MVVEVAGGLISGSLALHRRRRPHADRLRRARDGLARLPRRPPPGRRAAHLRLRPPLGAGRLRQRPRALRWSPSGSSSRPPAASPTPHPVEGGIMLAVAAAGLVVNLVAFRVLSARRPRATSTCAPRSCTSPATSSAPPAPSSPRSSSSRTGWTPIDPILSVLVVAPDPALGLDGGARQRPHPARGHPRGLRRRRHRRRPRRRRARGHRRPPPARLVDHRGPPDGHARGRGRRRRPTPTPRAGGSRRASPRPSASTTPPSRSASTTPQTPGCRRRAARLSRRSPQPEAPAHADQDPRDPSRPRRAPARGRDGDVRGDGAAPGHPPAADRAPQPDAEEGADRDPVRPRRSARRRCRSS